jgi:hypothetical protein
MQVKENVNGNCKTFKKTIWRKGIENYCTLFFLFYLTSFLLTKLLYLKLVNMSSLSAEIFASLYNFLKTSSLDKITASSIIAQQWNCFKIQSEDENFDCLMEILKNMAWKMKLMMISVNSILNHCRILTK